MDAKEQYKLAYRLVRLYFVERDEESRDTYPYWFDCPDRRDCGDYCACYREMEASNERYGHAKEEHRRIAPLVDDRIKVIAQQHYLDRRLKVPTCGLVQHLVNNGGYWNLKAYPQGMTMLDEPPRWRWTIFREIPEWNRAYSPDLETEKSKLRQRVIEALKERKS